MSLGPHLAGSAIHSLLLEFLSDLEVNLCGPHGGGGFDVEGVPLLFDLYCWLGGCSHSDLPQHDIDPCRGRQRPPGTSHTPSGTAGAGDSLPGLPRKHPEGRAGGAGVGGQGGGAARLCPALGTCS